MVYFSLFLFYSLSLRVEVYRYLGGFLELITGRKRHIHEH